MLWSRTWGMVRLSVGVVQLGMEAHRGQRDQCDWFLLFLASSMRQCAPPIWELSSDWTTPGRMEDDPWEYIVSPVTESLRECSFRYPMQWDHTERWSPHTTCGNERPVPISPGGCYIAAPANDSSTGVFTVSVCFLAVHGYSGYDWLS